ncbi:MAG: trypsin-like peptidase domain-containing protein [Capsulimonadaceae bacterium]
MTFLQSEINFRFHKRYVAYVVAPAIVACFALSFVPAIADVPATQPRTSESDMLAQMQDAFTQIAQTVEPTVVNIKAQRSRQDDGSDNPAPPPPAPEGPPSKKDKGDGNTGPDAPLPREPRFAMATGSGVIVRPDGYILTNDHVVHDADGGIVTVTLSDGRVFKGTVYSDYRSDLAVVKIAPGDKPLPAATFGDSADVRPGQWAIAVGSPFDLENTMTVGVISAIGRHTNIPGEMGDQSRYYPELIQTDAAINPGNSGGPLFDMNGHVVGINVAIESPVESNSGIGFAIPSDLAQRIMTKLITTGKVTRGYLGVLPGDLTPAEGQEYDQATGAFLRDVSVDSPAWKGGLRASDIITSFQDIPISGEVSLRDAIADAAPGSTAKVVYVRDGVPAVTSVIIGDFPAQKPDTTAPVHPAASTPKPHLGLTLRNLTAADRQSLGLPATTTGVFVENVEPGSPAEEAGEELGGVLTGTIIQKIGKTTIRTTADVGAAIQAAENEQQVTLVLMLRQENGFHQHAVTLQL